MKLGFVVSLVLLAPWQQPGGSRGGLVLADEIAKAVGESNPQGRGFGKGGVAGEGGVVVEDREELKSKTSPFAPAHRVLQSGNCGGGNRGDGICASGECCSQYGWCGTSADHCAGNPPPSPPSGGTCGGGSRGDGICANGECCSQYGWCGTSSEHCAGNPPPSPTPPSPTPPSSGTCGGGNQGDGICANDECCSQYGWCGTSTDHCAGNPPPSPPSGSKCSGCSWDNGDSCPDHWCNQSQSNCQVYCAGTWFSQAGQTSYCGCDSCNQGVWDAMAADGSGSYTCGTRISWLQSSLGYTENQACQTVSNEFPEICLCDPTSCNTSPEPTSKPTGQPSGRPIAPPTLKPTGQPSTPPSKRPTGQSTTQPTHKPTISTPSPSTSPSNIPTPGQTTTQPTLKPSILISNPATDPTMEPTPSPTTQLPTRSPSPSTSFSPTLHPTASSVPTLSPAPSSTPTTFPFLFDGIDSAGSMYRGAIGFLWDFPTYDNGDIVGLEFVRYHILSSVGAYDFKSALGNSTPEELIAEFDNNSLNETGIQYHLVNDGEAFEFTLNTTFHGELHTLLVIAEVDGVYSRNTDATDLYASESDPVMKEDVNIVGIFVPTDNLDIIVSPDNTILEFDGPVRQEHKDLAVGDYCLGFSTSKEIFMLLVTSIVESSDMRVVFNTEAARVEDIYEEIDFEASFGMSRPEKVEASLFSRNRHRHLIERRVSAQRKLIFGSIWNGIKDLGNGIVDGVKWIGDNLVEPIADVFEDLWNLVVNGEIEKSFELIGFDVSFVLETSLVNGELQSSFQLVDPGSGAGITWNPSTPAPSPIVSNTKFGQLNGRLMARSDVYVSMKVSLNSPQLVAEAGWRAEYSADFDLTLLSESELTWTKKDLWEGEKKVYKFAIGPVPVWLDVQPKLDSKITFKASSDSGMARLKMGGKGGGSLVASAQVPPKLSTDFKAPDFNPYFKADAIESIEFTAGLYVVPKVEVNLYSGAVKGDLSVTLGPELSTLTNVASALSGETCDLLESVDLSFTLSGDVSIGTEFDSSLEATLNLFEKSWPILKLGGTKCPNTGTCSGDTFFDNMSEDFGDIFNTQIFLAQGPSPSDPPFPSTVYKFEDFVGALKNLQGKEKFQMWLGERCGARAKKQALVNIAAFLGQAMRETIIYDACDENNWDLWNADVYKEPTSPAEIAPAFYPMSSSCGQLGQSYEDYNCEDACPKDSGMEITGSTNAKWIGAPPPLFCGPKSKYDGLGYWNPLKFCEGTGTDGTEESCVGQPFYYDGQTAGDHVPASEDSQYPEWYYANPIPGSDGTMQPPRFENLPRTNVEGCCWWGRGVIQTTGRCNFGKLNKNLGAAASNALYPDINFCSNPQAICDGPSELKWIAGIFFWTSEVEKYDGYKQWVDDFIDAGCTKNPDLAECDTLFKYASGIVNRGCPDPGEIGCPGCIPGATCDPAHNIPERIAASKQALRALINLPPGSGGGGSSGGGGGDGGSIGGTCGNGDRGDGVCPNTGDCCSAFGWCGTTTDHCA